MQLSKQNKTKPKIKTQNEIKKIKTTRKITTSTVLKRLYNIHQHMQICYFIAYFQTVKLNE